MKRSNLKRKAMREVNEIMEIIESEAFNFMPLHRCIEDHDLYHLEGFESGEAVSIEEAMKRFGGLYDGFMIIGYEQKVSDEIN